jgi:peroxiredoxin
MLGTGELAPSFELKDAASGTVMSLSDVLAKGPAVLAFFKISCPVCQLTMPYLERMAGSGTLQFIGISQDDARDTEKFNRAFGVRMETLLDERRNGYPASKAYKITNVPSLFLVEPDGRISASVAGFSKRDLEAIGERAGVAPFTAADQVPEFRPG